MKVLVGGPLRAIGAGAIEAKQLKEVDPSYATEMLTAVAKAFFFWPKFLIGELLVEDSQAVMDDCVDMVPDHFGRPPKG